MLRGDFLALHGTATQVSMVLIAFMAPFDVISSIAGVFVDRWHLKRTMVASDLIRSVLVVVQDLYVIYAVLFRMSVVSSFFIPAQSVAVRTLLPMTGLMAVNGSRPGPSRVLHSVICPDRLSFRDDLQGSSDCEITVERCRYRSGGWGCIWAKAPSAPLMGRPDRSILLVWVYYSSQIFFLGAEFTRIYTREFGSQLSSSLTGAPTNLQATLVTES